MTILIIISDTPKFSRSCWRKAYSDSQRLMESVISERVYVLRNRKFGLQRVLWACHLGRHVSWDVTDEKYSLLCHTLYRTQINCKRGLPQRKSDILTSSCSSESGLCGSGGLRGRSCRSSYSGAGGGARRADPAAVHGPDDFEGSRFVTFRLCLRRREESGYIVSHESLKVLVTN